MLQLSQHVGDVMDADNESHYKKMVKEIHVRNAEMIKIFVNIKYIEKLPSTDDSNAGSSGKSSEDDDVR